MTELTKKVNGVTTLMTETETEEHNARQVRYEESLLPSAKKAKREKIKEEAGRRILVEYPEYKQRNLMGAVINIQNKELIALKVGEELVLTADEQAILAAATECKAYTDHIRAKSNELEAPVEDMTLEELEAFNAADDVNWQ